MGFLGSAMLFAAGLFAVWYLYFPSPKENALVRELDQSKAKYQDMNIQVDRMVKVLENLQDRDEGIHRFVLGMDPLDEDIREAGIGGSEKYEDIIEYKNTGQLVKQTQQRIDQLERQLVVQSQSLEEVQSIAAEKADRLASMPSIKPVQEDRLNRKITLLSGFGTRMHPVHNVNKMHQGIDFTCPTGTPIQATAKGKVIKLASSKSGYGKHIIIDHGYGYKTLYAHMSAFDVDLGDEVVKGQKIGEVGNTGTSTAPHCHYEVRINDIAVNPIHFCLDGLSPEEYKELLELASVHNHSFD